MTNPNPEVSPQAPYSPPPSADNLASLFQKAGASGTTTIKLGPENTDGPDRATGGKVFYTSNGKNGAAIQKDEDSSSLLWKLN